MAYLRSPFMKGCLYIMEPNIDSTKTLKRILTKKDGKVVEIKLSFPETVHVSSLADISDNGVYSGENLFLPSMYENQFK